VNKATSGQLVSRVFKARQVLKASRGFRARQVLKEFKEQQGHKVFRVSRVSKDLQVLPVLKET
jgi:hypothetical protein